MLLESQWNGWSICLSECWDGTGPSRSHLDRQKKQLADSTALFLRPSAHQGRTGPDWFCGLPICVSCCVRPSIRPSGPDRTGPVHLSGPDHIVKCVFIIVFKRADQTSCFFRSGCSRWRLTSTGMIGRGGTRKSCANLQMQTWAKQSKEQEKQHSISCNISIT